MRLGSIERAATIHRADRDGGNAVELLSELGLVVDLTVDVAHGKLYWTEISGSFTTPSGKLRRANLDGTGVQDIVTRDTAVILSVAVDETGDKLYWTEADQHAGKVRRANLDGTNVEDLIMDSMLVPLGGGALPPRGLEIAEGKMYFVAGPHAVVIARANLDGSGLEVFKRETDGYFADFVLDAEDGKIYWATFSSAEDTAHRIQRANLDGSHVEEIATFADSVVVGIDVDAIGRKIVWTEASGRFGLGSGGESTTRVRQANRDGSAAEDLVVHTTAVHAPQALALDVLGKKMYWAEAPYGPGETEVLIRRANLDGSATVNLVRRSSSSDRVQIHGFALDVVDGKMYWAVEEHRSGASDVIIRRANLDGTGQQDLPITTEVLDAIALDALAGKIYWADGRTIRQANLDGTDQKDLAVDASNADALAIDLVGGKIYWTDNDGVRSANLDGTGQADLAANVYANELAIDPVGGKMYWSGDGSLRRANLDGTGQEELVQDVYAYSIALGTR